MLRSLLCGLLVSVGVGHLGAQSHAQAGSTAPLLHVTGSIAMHIDETNPIPAGGESMLAGTRAFELRGAAVSDATFSQAEQALRVETIKKPENPWQIQISAPTTLAMQQGDALLIRFRARAIKGQAETGEARTFVVVERAGEPYTKSLHRPVVVSGAWKQYEFAFRAAQTLDAGEAQVNFQLGVSPQVIEFADIELLNYADRVAVEDLPGSVLNYDGRSLDAPWREEATARIEQIRKGPIRISVVDGSGKAVEGATVRVRMERHAFAFGSAVVARRFSSDDPNDAIYRKVVENLFNQIVFENDLKWPNWERHPERRTEVLAALDWLEARDIKARGHVLVWPGWGSSQNPTWVYTPIDVRELAEQKPEGYQQKMKQRVLGRIDDVMQATKGRLNEWDVINETWSNHDLMDVLGNQVMIDWFKRARENDPNTKLYYNDFTMLSGGAVDPDRQDHLYNTIRYLIDNGAPIDAIGEQAHFGETPVEPVRMLQILDRFAEFGLPIRITEFDINTPDERYQADYTRDFYTAAFSHPSVNGIVMWGFWEGSHWMPQAAMYRRDFTPKPNAEVFIDLVFNQWWTNNSGLTNEQGQFATRGFFGEYEITIETGGKTVTRPISHTADSSITISLD